jgi:ParB-like chromosome segregation protein Spo0J
MKSQLTAISALPDLAQLRPHPIAAEFPMASDADFENLRASIADRGFLASEHIILIGSPPMILDGRNRFRAAKACGVKLTVANFLQFTGSEAEAEAFSNAKNGARRHLTNGKRYDDPLVRELM